MKENIGLRLSRFLAVFSRQKDILFTFENAARE